MAENTTIAPLEKPAAGPPMRAARLPFHPGFESRFADIGVTQATWMAVVEACFPLASSYESVGMALSYCKARNLDPFKKVIHIVPIWNKQLGRMVDTIWSSITELRTVAMRTREYCGKDATEWGPDLTETVGKVEVTFPEWAQVTVHRKIQGERFEFPGPKVYWLETYTPAGRNDSSPNDMWKKRVRGQLEKCAEASALRVAFPEELGTDYIQEEQYAPSANAKEIADTIAGVIPPAPPQPLNTITAALEAELTPTADEIGAAPEPEPVATTDTISEPVDDVPTETSPHPANVATGFADRYRAATTQKALKEIDATVTEAGDQIDAETAADLLSIRGEAEGRIRSKNKKKSGQQESLLGPDEDIGT